MSTNFITRAARRIDFTTVNHTNKRGDCQVAGPGTPAVPRGWHGFCRATHGLRDLRSPRAQPSWRVEALYMPNNLSPSNVLFRSLSTRVRIKSQSGMRIHNAYIPHNLLSVEPTRFDRLYSHPTGPFLKHR